MDKVVDGERDCAGEVVGGEIQASQASEASERGWELAGELVLLEVEASEEGQIGEIGGDLAGEAIGAETEDTELCKIPDCVGWDSTHEADGG